MDNVKFGSSVKIGSTNQIDNVNRISSVDRIGSRGQRYVCTMDSSRLDENTTWTKDNPRQTINMADSKA
jgi:hypothetical protein